MINKDVLYLMKQSKEDLHKRWIPNYKLLFQLFSSIQRYFSTVLNIPQNKIINQGYQEFFTKYFFNIDRYRKFLEKVHPPYIIYNVQNFELDRTKLNQKWNSDEGLFQQELKKYFLHIQRSYLRQGLNVSLYLDSREQLLTYLSYLLGTFDFPNGQFLVEYDLSEFIPDDEPLLKNEKLIFTDIISIINPTTFEDSSEYLFDEQMRTFKLSFSFTLEGYVLTKIRFFSKEEGISQFIINSLDNLQSNVYTKLNYDETYPITIETTPDTNISINLIDIQKENIKTKSSEPLNIIDYTVTITTDKDTYTITQSDLQNQNNNLIIVESTPIEISPIVEKEFKNLIIDFSNYSGDFVLQIQYDGQLINIPSSQLNSQIDIQELLSSIIGTQIDLSLIDFIMINTEVLVYNENNNLVINNIEGIDVQTVEDIKNIYINLSNIITPTEDDSINTIIGIQYNNQNISISHNEITNPEQFSIIENISNIIGEPVFIELISTVNISVMYNDTPIDSVTIVSRDENNNLVIQDTVTINKIENIIEIKYDSESTNIEIKSIKEITPVINYEVNNKYTVYTTTNIEDLDSFMGVKTDELQLRLYISMDKNTGKKIIKWLEK